MNVKSRRIGADFLQRGRRFLRRLASSRAGMDGVVPVRANVVTFDAEFTHLRIADDDWGVDSGVSGGCDTKPRRCDRATNEMKHGVE